MPSFFLKEIPREIRDEIYNHVLVSPTGFIRFLKREAAALEGRWRPRREIRPFDPKSNRKLPGPPIDSALLRVSKQIHAESRDTFWRHNALYLMYPSELGLFMGSDKLAHLFSQNLSQVCIDLGVYRLNHPESYLRTLVGWSRTGNLRKCTFRIAHNSPQGLFDRRWPAKYLSMWVDTLQCIGAHDEQGFSPEVEKNLVIDTHQWNSYYVKQLAGREFMLEPVLVLLLDLHNALGGGLWIDEQLWYKDGLRVGEIKFS